MAGGSGSRLWPLSRKQQPKQLLKFLNRQTLLQNTYVRLSKVFSVQHIFVATTGAYAPHIRQQLPKIPAANYSIETETKDRGPAIGLAALLMHRRDPASCFVTTWSDHHISPEAAYFKILKQAEKYLSQDSGAFITIGVKPSFAHTGLGYIEKGQPIPHAGGKILRARSFKEKPSLPIAKKFVSSGRYLWNTGYFVCTSKNLLELYRQHLPKIYDLLMKIKPFLGTPQQDKAIKKYYPLMPKADIEHDLIEKLKNVVTLPADFQWVDVGSWKVIKDTLAPGNKNLTLGQTFGLNTTGSLVYNLEDKLVATVGLEDIVIVNTKDALLVTSKAHSEQVKQLVEQLKKNKKLLKYL